MSIILALSPSTVIVRAMLEETLADRFLRVSRAFISPFAIIKALSQTALISCKIWEQRIMVWSFFKSLINFLTSRIWLGSSPTVGSSRISISGLPRRAKPLPCL